MPSEIHGKLSTGEPCVLVIGDERMAVEVPRHDLHPRDVFRGDRPVSQRIVIELANGQVAVLTSNYSLGFSGHLGPRSFSLDKIGSNQVLVGHYEFPPDGLVEAISFEPTHPEVSIFYRNHRSHRHLRGDQLVSRDELFGPELIAGEIIVDAVDTTRLTACSVRSGNRSVEFRVGIAEQGGPQGFTVAEHREVSVKFADPVELSAAIDAAHVVSAFHTFMVGQPIGFSQARIFPAIDRKPGEFPRELTLHLPRGPERASETPKIHQCLMSCHVDQDLYAAALKTWLDRERTWRKSYSQARTCLAQRNTIGRAHYLSAAAWFESIPRFYVPRTARIDRVAIKSAAAAASQALNGAGHDVSETRLTGLMGPINEPSLNSLVGHAITYARDRFSLNAVPESVRDVLPGLVKIRARYAHGDIPEADFSPREIYCRTVLLELLAGYLTLSALPWDFARLQQAQGHHLRDAWMELFWVNG